MEQAHNQVKKQQQMNEPFFLSIDKQIPKIKQQKKSKPRKIIRQNTQKYHWKHKENIKYLEFVILSRRLFDLDLEEKRYIGINKLMSDYIKTRDSVQCHSHHQKILKKYGSIDQAIAQLTNMYFKKSRFLRKKKYNPVKIEQNSFQRIKEEESGYEATNTKGQALTAINNTKELSQQVKTEQIQAS